MPEFVRVRDKATGHQYTLGASTVEAEPHLYEVLKKPAVDTQGVPLPAKPNLQRGAAAASDEPSEKWTVKKIDAYAEERGIDLSNASTKADKLSLISDTQALADPGDSSQPPSTTPDDSGTKE